MKPSAILYTSNTGFTRQYAQLLSGRTGLPAFTLEEAETALRPGSPVVYLGWLMAGKIQGYAKAAKRYAVQAVCGVGMGATGSQIADIRKTNALPEALPAFTLQGGFDRKRLKGVYKFMMGVMANTLGKQLAAKPDRTPDEDQMLTLLQQGGNLVREENLEAVLTWYEGECQ